MIITIIFSLIGGRIIYSVNNKDESEFKTTDFITYSVICFMIISFMVEVITRYS